MLWYIGHLFGCRLRRREKGHGVSIITALRLFCHMRPTRCYRQSGKDFASKIVQPARGRLPYRAASGRLAASLLRLRKPPTSRGRRHARPAAVSGYFRSAGRFLALPPLPQASHVMGPAARWAGSRIGLLPVGWPASFAPPLLPQASHVTGPARAGGHIGLLPVGWPLPLLYLRCRKPPTSRGRHGPAAISGYFRSAGRFLCSTSAAASLPRYGAGAGRRPYRAASGRLAASFAPPSAAASLPRHGASGTLVRRKTCAL